MAKKLRIWLPDHWANISNEIPDGVLTLVWNDSTATGAFQISTAEYSGGREPHPSEADLIQMAIGFGEQQYWGSLVSSKGGTCKMGSFGTASFRLTDPFPPDLPTYCQVWHLSNGLDFVMATFIAMKEPPQIELADAQRIAEGIDFS
jgi:hypothetical protein